MANEEHVALLKQGAEVWNRWRRENPNMRPDLSKTNLRKADLGGADFIDADRREALLKKAGFKGAGRSGVNFLRALLREAGSKWGGGSGADLSGADLGDTNLSDANLSKAKLSDAYLGKADLSGADLSEADLSKANLNRAKLIGADLSKANLSEARLNVADFREANLDGANLHWAILQETVLGDTNLIEISGLDTCEYYGPNIIDHRTLMKSGPLPIEFLRGCGLSDWQIEAAKLNDPNLTSPQAASILDERHHLRFDNQIQYYSAFISYSHADKDFARHLHDQLQDKGIRCWLDEHQMLPGDDIYEQVDRGIRLWDI